MWRGIAFIAESTSSSRMPSMRRRSTIRARVRSDVMPLPLSPPPAVPIGGIPSAIVSAGSSLEPCRHAAHLVAIGQVDLQRRDRHVVTLDGMKIRAFARIGRFPCGADPVHRLSARTLHPDDVLGLVPAAQPGDPVAAYSLALDVGHVDIQQPRPCRLASMPIEQ